ncbi:hypothetical protein [Paenibacillus sp. YSY-4.3]
MPRRSLGQEAGDRRCAGLLQRSQLQRLLRERLEQTPASAWRVCFQQEHRTSRLFCALPGGWNPDSPAARRQLDLHISRHNLVTRRLLHRPHAPSHTFKSAA